MPFSQAAQAMSVYQTVENPRDTEYRLFAQVTNALINHRDCHDKGTIEAIDWNRRLWLTLQSDVSSEANALSDDLRANLISLAIWVDRHSRAVMRGEASMEPLIQVNRTVMEGLAQ